MTELNPLSPSDIEEVNPHQLFPYFDNGVVESLYVKSMALPAMRMLPGGKVSERPPVIMKIEPVQKAITQLMKAAQSGFPHFKIVYRNAMLEEQSTWTLYGAHISALDFGEESQEAPKIVQCEITYESLDINGVRL